MTPEPTSVILVDDAADVRLLVRTTLHSSRQFVVVAEAENGLDAIAAAARLQPEVMLLDVSMPVMDGLEALPRVLQVSPETCVVMYSSFDSRGLAVRAKQLGASAFLEKSTSIRRLPGDVADVLIRNGWRGSAMTDAGDGDDDDAEVHDDGEVHDGDVHDDGVAGADGGVAADALDRHLERFREVFEEAAIGMGTMTLTGHLVRANRALADLVGCSMDELVGVPYSTLTKDLTAERMEEVLSSFATGTDVARFEHEVSVDGVVRRLLATVSPARDDQKRLLYHFLQLQDVTAQRSAEDELLLSEARFRLLVDSVTDYAIFMLGPDGTVMSWNAGAQRLGGYRAEDVIGQHFRIFHPDDKRAAKLPEYELEIARRDGRYEDQGWRVRENGTHFWADTIITAVRNHVGDLIGFANVTRDVSELRTMLVEREAAGRALAVANARLKLANMRQTRTVADQAEFVAVTIHELRNPLSVVTGAAEMLTDHLEALAPHQRSELVTSMRSSANRLNRLLADLLASSRLESRAMNITLEEVDVAELLAQVVVTAAQSWPDVPVIAHSDAGLTVQADRDRLAQAIDNLVINALRHGSGPVELTASSNAEAVEIRVSDAGPGVPDELRPRLFERFATGRGTGGTGLGLFIVRELARAHGGDARYETTTSPNSSACFVISIPRTTPAAPSQ